jgi:hypothetical protein
MKTYDLNAPHYYLSDGRTACAECADLVPFPLNRQDLFIVGAVTLREKWELLKGEGAEGIVCDECRSNACPICHEVVTNQGGCSCWLCSCMTTNHRTATECRSCHKEGNQ